MEKKTEKEEQKFITDIAELEREKERERELERRKAKERAKKRKLIPPFMMLLTGAIASITMFVLHYKTKDMLIILLCVLLVFYIAGEVFKWMLDRFEAQIEEAQNETGEVYEKNPDENTARRVRITETEDDEDETAQSGKTERRREDDEEELIF